ncbi:CoxG family protein [Sphingoaurantiacus capsulatus]|uniref:CoxG family protein n=1 Tax=Sphingoaurantiacus capsulatus TaxID=1771310 RepID=A0ABV7XBZ1_9SPHN
MEIQGDTLIAAPRERVWAALNDPAVLARCIEGVESLEKVGDSRFEGKLNAKVGPVRASFTGGVDLQNLNPPTSYTIAGEGKGGVAGFAKGAADVSLTEEALPDGGTGTRLSYVARSTIGGKLAQLGARLVEGTARSYAETFFARLKAEVEGPAPAAEPVAAEIVGDAILEPPSLPVTDTEDSGKGIPPIVWGSVLTLLMVLFIWLMLA